MDGRELARTPPVRDFALAIGQWLLARRFGAITPLAFRYQLWESYEDEDIRPHLFIELLVNDPPPPSPEWLALSEEERDARPIREWARNRLWPREDRWALEEGARKRAKALGVPDALDDVWPLVVGLRGRTEAKKLGMRFPHVAIEAAAR